MSHAQRAFVKAAVNFFEIGTNDRWLESGSFHKDFSQSSSAPLTVRWSSMYIQIIQKTTPDDGGTAPVISLLKARGPGYEDSRPLDGTMLLFWKVAAVLGKMPANSLFNCTLTRPDFRLESWDILIYIYIYFIYIYMCVCVCLCVWNFITKLLASAG